MNISRRHSDSGYQRELERLLDRVLFMGARVESHFTRALGCYLQRERDQAQELASSEDRIRQLEVEIDSACVEILSRYQAMASDLRFITMTFKVARDLQRIGVLSTGICRMVLEGEQDPVMATSVGGLARMGELARDMLRRALDAYVAKDALIAGEVVAWDRQLDEQYRAFWGEAAAQMASAPPAVPELMRRLAVAKAVERIADHAVSVSEMVVFMVEGSTERRSSSRVMAARHLG